jgi:hypothetical protein
MGLLTIYLPNTSAALLIQENASPCAISCRATPPARWSCRSSARRHHGRLRRGFCLSLVDGKMLRKRCFQDIDRPHTRGVSHWWCGRLRSKFPTQMNREINPVNREINLPIRELNRSNTEGGRQHVSRNWHVYPARIFGSCAAIAFKSCEGPRKRLINRHESLVGLDEF